MKLERLRRALVEGAPVRDEDFDAIYPLAYQRLSHRYWTSVETARRAADLLVGGGARRVLDVGAGAGKLCLVGAASTGVTFTGIEHRAHLVAAGREAARLLRQERVELISGRLDEIATDLYDAFYFYNPFAENLVERELRFDHGVHLSRERHDADLRHATSLLLGARAGTHVVTFHGCGVTMPPCYARAHFERRQGGPLELWIRDTSGRARSRAPSACKLAR